MGYFVDYRSVVFVIDAVTHKYADTNGIQNNPAANVVMAEINGIEGEFQDAIFMVTGDANHWYFEFEIYDTVMFSVLWSMVVPVLAHQVTEYRLPAHRYNAARRYRIYNRAVAAGNFYAHIDMRSMLYGYGS